MTSSDWEWFAYQNPVLGPNRVYLAIYQDHDLVAISGFSPVALFIRSKSIRASYAHHMVIDSRHRQGMMFITLSRYAFDKERNLGTEVIIGPPNRYSYMPHKVLMHWGDFGYMDTLCKMEPRSRSHKCVIALSFGKEFDDLYATVSKKLSFHFNKTALHMNWRFFQRPNNPYTVFKIRSYKMLRGYIVLKRWEEADGYRKAHIMDMHALDDEALYELLGAAETYAANCDELNLWCVVGYPYRTQLETIGFVVSKTARQPIIIRGLNGENPVFDGGPASFMYGDGDGY
jgi:hypothetical protein